MSDTVTFAAVDQQLFSEVSQFMGYEAMLLDWQRFDEWLALCDEDIIYQVPVRVVTKSGADEYNTGAYRMNDNYIQLAARIKRNASGAAWAEEPPSRMIRNVGSLYVEHTDQADVISVQTAVSIFRRRAQDEYPDSIPVRRVDHLKMADGGFKILKRVIYMGDNVMRTPNLSIIL